MEGEQRFPYHGYELLNEYDSLLEFHLHLTPWHQLTDLRHQDNALVHSLPTSELGSIEEDLTHITESQEQNQNHSQESIIHTNISHGAGGAVEVHNYESTSANVDYGLLMSCNDSAEYEGVRLVHLLLACAEAMTDASNDLVDTILCRLGELVSPTGSTIQTVAYYSFRSLDHLHHHKIHNEGSLLGSNELCNSITRDPNFLGTLSLLNQVYPYIRIAHFTANQSILEAIPEDSRSHNVHIIDFDIMEGMQWPTLMAALKSENYEISNLKITAIKWVDEEENDTARRLCEYASSLGIPFSFQKTELENVKGILRHSEDEIVVVNCSGIETHENLSFLERFDECLRNMCSVFDSLEAGLRNEYGLARAMVERLFMGPMVCRSFNSLSTNEDRDFARVMDISVKCGFEEREI